MPCELGESEDMRFSRVWRGKPASEKINEGVFACTWLHQRGASEN